MGNNPTLYGYVNDANTWIDVFGLDTFYQLFNDGNLIYEGITERNIQERLIEHIYDGKNFSKVRYVDDLGNRIEARNMEGSSLFHNKSNQFQLNKRRIDEGFYHSYDPNKIKTGRTFLSVEEIEARMQKGKTADVNPKCEMSNVKCH